MSWSHEEILQTVQMTEREHFDVRTVTLGISLRDCASDSLETMKRKIYDKITRLATRHVAAARQVEERWGITIANKRISITPLSIPGEQMKAAGFAYHSIGRASVV